SLDFHKKWFSGNFSVHLSGRFVLNRGFLLDAQMRKTHQLSSEDSRPIGESAQFLPDGNIISYRMKSGDITIYTFDEANPGASLSVLQKIDSGVGFSCGFIFSPDGHYLVLAPITLDSFTIYKKDQRSKKFNQHATIHDTRFGDLKSVSSYGVIVRKY